MENKVSTFVKSNVVSNGLSTLTLNLPSLGSFLSSFTVGFKIGSHVESSELNGINHFVEHMMFKGTNRRSGKELIEGLEVRGLSLSAFTDRQNQIFSVTGPKKNIRYGADALVDCLANPAFTSEAVEREKLTVIKEMEEVGQDPVEVLVRQNLYNSKVDLFHKMSFKQGLGLPILGARFNIENFTREDVFEAWKQRKGIVVCDINSSFKSKDARHLASALIPLAAERQLPKAVLRPESINKRLVLKGFNEPYYSMFLEGCGKGSCIDDLALCMVVAQLLETHYGFPAFSVNYDRVGFIGIVSPQPIQYVKAFSEREVTIAKKQVVRKILEAKSNLLMNAVSYCSSALFASPTMDVFRTDAVDAVSNQRVTQFFSSQVPSFISIHP